MKLTRRITKAKMASTPPITSVTAKLANIISELVRRSNREIIVRTSAFAEAEVGSRRVMDGVFAGVKSG